MNESVSSINCWMYYYQPDPLPMWTFEVVHWIVHGSTRFVNLRQRKPKKVGHATLGGWRLNSMFRPIETSRLDELVAWYMGGRLPHGAQFLLRFSLGFIRAIRTRKKENGMRFPNGAPADIADFVKLVAVRVHRLRQIFSDVFFKTFELSLKHLQFRFFEWNFTRVTSSRCFRRFLPEFCRIISGTMLRLQYFREIY